MTDEKNYKLAISFTIMFCLIIAGWFMWGFTDYLKNDYKNLAIEECRVLNIQNQFLRENSYRFNDCLDCMEMLNNLPIIDCERINN